MLIDFTKASGKKNISRRELLIGFCALLAFGVSLIFPQKAYGENFWLSLFLFFLFPAATILFLLKEPLKNFGLTWGKTRSGIILSFIFAAIFIFVNYYILYHTKYGGSFSVARGIIGSFTMFLLFEIFIILPLHFFWEFFFRGFLQLGFEKRLGFFSLLIPAILQTILYFRSGWTMLFLVLASSLGAGLIVQKSRSIFYSTLALWLISVSLDIMIIRIAHQIAR